MQTFVVFCRPVSGCDRMCGTGVHREALDSMCVPSSVHRRDSL
ncbi:hypothetical protein CGLO_11246 [Colletotrichum gloeosporioides Cg-14]|uniref:Uncharacterized protein n=1 Tax=Colletotrichum gloeosporioides (strain Cg-14) TaxID=1237896 RepID=T0K8R2_COLGC|nr:hypothetical protein CGLO_11246 [Colletotrichum gloeosporioides Cg-14]